MENVNSMLGGDLEALLRLQQSQPTWASIISPLCKDY